MFLIKNIQIPIEDEIDLKGLVAAKFRIPASSVEGLRIMRKALDARKKNHLKYNFTLIVDSLPEIEHPDIINYKEPQPYISPARKLKDPNPFIIGAGPAGLFTALGLVEQNLKPMIFDRGESLDQRIPKVKEYWSKGILDEDSNVQFGEGGAGTFSDGKLTARNRDFYSNRIIEYLIRFGADSKISYEALPHLGTDKLRKIITNIRIYLQEKGCRFHWNSKLSDMVIQDGKLKHAVINDQTYSPEALFLATGNAAREIFVTLDKYQAVSSKPFAVGVRIEHSQNYIDQAFYGDKMDLSITGPATYRLTANNKGRGTYTFCMCPGGYVIGAASGSEHLVVNGMSFSDRNNQYANSAIVVSVTEKDFGANNLAGMHFQQKIEKKCFITARNYTAPAQAARDFVNGRATSRSFRNSFRPSVNRIDINPLFPPFLSQELNFALTQFNKRVPGFIDKGILIAPETRTSSPVRINRDKSRFNSLVANNLFPVGEGSGYAGGIISSAVDGYKISKIFYY